MVDSKAPAYLFVGDDDYLKEKSIKDLTSSILGPGSRDLDYKAFYGAEAEPNEVLDQINTVPFLAARRLVVVRGLEKSAPELRKRLADYLKRPLKTTCLVMEASGDPESSGCAAIADLAAVRRFGSMTARETAAWIGRGLSDLGKKIDDDAAALLVEMHGHNLSALSQEIGKLAAYSGHRVTIGRADVEEVAGRSLISSVFDLADAMGEGDSESAMRICGELVREGKKEYEIIGLLSWHMKRLLRAASMRSKLVDEARIAYALRVGQRYRAGFFRQVSGLGMGRIKAHIRLLLEADLDIKRTRFDPTLVLEFAVIRLCRKASS